jgi:hypothetical protein
MHHVRRDGLDTGTAVAGTRNSTIPSEMRAAALHEKKGLVPLGLSHHSTAHWTKAARSSFSGLFICTLHCVLST